ncbi:MAG: tRNA lysidine(34) synthetase TilS [Clostridia bacterium]|nr:tRNA lysidine(34) synthetase TilS [Clostridia bacterium]
MSEQRLTDGLPLTPPWRAAGLPPDTPVLLAFSGGADSRALLHLLVQRQREDGFSLILAHVNHGIRGAESVRDREFCRAVAARYGLEICVLDADVPSLAAQNGRGLEEEARCVRYDFFARVMQERNIPILATAHHADDQLETVLFHLARGSGLRGLCGIVSTRPFAGGTLVRPLLSVSRCEILQYCEQNGLDYVTDSTNADGAYARNRLRSEVVPVLESLFGHPQKQVARLSAHLQEDEALLTALSEDVLQKSRNGAGLSLLSLRQAPVPLCKRALVMWLEREYGCAPESVHLNALMRLVRQETPTARISLPGDLVALAERGCLVISNTPSVAPTPYRYPLCEGECVIGESGIRILVQKAENPIKVHNLSTASYINFTVEFDIIKKGLYWRPRKEGDTLLFHGMHRKVRKLFRELGMPQRLRDILPLLCDGDGILWVPTVGCRDGFAAAQGERPMALVQIFLPERWQL